MDDRTQVKDENSAERRWGAAESWLIGIGAGLVVVALMGATYTIGYNQGKGDAEPAGKAVAEQPSEQQPAAATGPGKELFTQTCGSCHTLADAETTGTVGPNLDVLGPDAATVESAIRIGGTGTGAMPPNLYSGQQAKQVAEYVAAVAGE